MTFASLGSLPYTPLYPTVALNTPIDAAISLARVSRRSTLFVIELGDQDAVRLLGEVRLGDLLRRWLTSADCANTSVCDLLMPISHTVRTTELGKIPQILDVFQEHHLEHIPVLNRADECVGLLDRSQCFEWIMRHSELTPVELDHCALYNDNFSPSATQDAPLANTKTSDPNNSSDHEHTDHPQTDRPPIRHYPESCPSSSETQATPEHETIQRLLADIADYKLLEGKLYSSYMQMQILFDVMRDVTAIVAVTKDGFDVNIPSATLFDDPIRSAVVEQAIEAFLAETETNTFQESVRLALQNDRTIECKHQFEVSNQTLYFEALVSPISATSVLWVARDITTLKQIEQALKVSQERFRYLLTSNPAVVYTCNVDNHAWKTFVGDNIRDLLGYDPACWIDDPNFWRTRLHPDDARSVAESLATLNERGHCVMEYRFLAHNGSYRWLRDELKLAIDTSNSQPIEGIGSLVDISDRKRAEESILEALEKERELNELKSRFVSMASHEFRTPLAIIQSAAQLLERYELDPDEKQEKFEQINTSIAHMNQLLKDVLTLGKAEAGTISFNPEPLAIRQFCQLLVSQLQTAIGRSHRIAMTIDDRINETTIAHLDEKLVRQMLTNLLSNAIKYSPNADRVELTVTLLAPEQLQFSVTDRGIGIPPSDLPRLCESFHRAANVGTIQGTGLGLAIVQRCVSLHGGTIDFDSRVNSGTTVTIQLPQASSVPMSSQLS